jgi:hypothetical protein
VRARREPRPGELRRAIEATAALQASETLQMERRAYGREVERQLRERLKATGYEKRPTPNKREVSAPKYMPGPNTTWAVWDQVV